MTKQKPVTVATLRRLKQQGEKFACLTAYDASFATLVDEAGVDVILVGDSLGMVVHGRDDTVAVTVDDIVYHSRCVARGRQRALLMADMPFMSYATAEQALANAARLMQEGGAHAVKLEGGAAQVDTVRLLSERGIPVCAHLGLQPQFVHRLGGYKVQGREVEAAQRMRRDAQALQEAGADLLLLESVPRTLAADITREVALPVIGIGAGSCCDGQILVLYDMLGVTPGHRPRFTHDFLDEEGTVPAALRAYVAAVKSGCFPGPEHGFD
ncbi:MAG TPA: 3-methyl-2-oxobutanoate hydroxymethyltransferase [Gammaproteobacteria bacterium]|nr:3-methyl-2-oxobutanoate hydroxymethyltransferase [Gammaproteobacteria bacterium]